MVASEVVLAVRIADLTRYKREGKATIWEVKELEVLRGRCVMEQANKVGTYSQGSDGVPST